MRITLFIAAGLTKEQRNAVPAFEFPSNFRIAGTVPRLVRLYFIENKET
jgi:hypothetical protein